MNGFLIVDDSNLLFQMFFGMPARIIIASFDSDFFQLITEEVSVLRYRGDNTVVCTPDYIRNRFQIEPAQYADFKSMVGDASDHIRGADKIGPKTAAGLLKRFGTLDNILANAESIERPSVRDSIIRNTERLRTNHKMIKLDNTAQLPFALHELAYAFTGVTAAEVLKGIGLS